MRRLLESVLVVLLLAFAALVVVTAVGGDDGCENGFDQAAWEEGGDRRMAEAERIVECGTLKGRSRGELRALLGKPGERSARRRETWTWEIGPEESGYPLDSRFLAIEFSLRGRAERARLYDG